MTMIFFNDRHQPAQLSNKCQADSLPQLKRRAFLRLAASGIAGTWVASADVASANLGGKAEPRSIETATEKAPVKDTPDQRVGFALVGMGQLSMKQLLPAFGKSKHARVVALVSGDRNKALRLAHQYGVREQAIYDYQNYDHLADNPEVDVIYIVLPNSMHAEFTIRGARAGKHILCEKPMANSVAECQQMINACRQANRKLMIAYRSQYEPNDRALLKMIQEKQLGALREFISSNSLNQGNPNQWRLKKAMSGGGPLPDIGIYCINAARFLSGEEPIEVIGNTYTSSNDVRFKEVEESVHFILRFPSGYTATCTSSYSSYKSQFLRIQGSAMWAELDPAYAYTGLKLHTGCTQNSQDIVQEYDIDTGDQFAKEMDHMAQCVRQDKQPYTPGEEGLQDIRIIEAIYQSAREGRPVKLAVPPPTRGPEPAENT